MSTCRIAILGSTRGTSAQTMIDEHNCGQLNGTIEVVVSNNESAYILTRAKQNGLDFACIPATGLSRESYDQKLHQLLLPYRIDLIVLVGFMRILSASFIQHWQHKIINVHPSLLPKHKGLMDMAVHESVLRAKDKKTGCSVHYVTEAVDAGQVIIQKACAVEANDIAQTLKEKVQALEGAALVEAINLISKNSNYPEATLTLP